MTDDSKPVASDMAVWRATLTVLQELNKAGDLYILLMPPFAAEFGVDEDAVKARLENVPELELDGFKAKSDEISTLVYLILEGSEESYKKHVLRRQREAEDEPPDENIDEKFKLVSESGLVDDRLRRRYTLKKTSKAPAFMDVDWDVKVKLVDAHESTVFPYATCKIKYQRDFEASPFALVSGRLFDAMQINLTRDEVVYLRKVLQRVERQLENVEAMDIRMGISS